MRLGFPRPKPTPYNLRMVDQTTTKPMGLIRDLKIYVHDIPYIITFTVLQNSVVDFSYSMLLGKPWLRCCNPSLGLVTKARASKSAGQE
jgi:hypothetical protein